MTPVLLPQIRCLLNGSSCTETMAVTTISAAGIATATESAAADTAHSLRAARGAGMANATLAGAEPRSCVASTHRDGKHTLLLLLLSSLSADGVLFVCC